MKYVDRKNRCIQYKYKYGVVQKLCTKVSKDVGTNLDVLYKPHQDGCSLPFS